MSSQCQVAMMVDLTQLAGSWRIKEISNSLGRKNTCHGGDRKGNELAEVWEKGKRSTRTCLGVFVCDNRQCERVTRPKVDTARLDAHVKQVHSMENKLLHAKLQFCTRKYRFALENIPSPTHLHTGTHACTHLHLPATQKSWCPEEWA